jgi:hypothetical protein
VDVRRVISYRETYSNNGDGTISLVGARDTEMNDGGDVHAEWSGTLNLLTPLTPGHANLVVLNYDFQSFGWQNDGQNAVFSKSLLVKVISAT